MTTDTIPDVYDVAVVGAGPAGLATAYHLRGAGRRVIVLERADEVGGRTFTTELAGEQVNTGAMFVYRDTPTHILADELGVELTPFLPSSYGIHLDGITVVSRDNDDLVDRLPLSASARAGLRSFIHQALAEYRWHTVGGRLAGTSDELRLSSADARLSGLHPRVRAILEAAIQGGSVAKPSQLTAQYALRYFASYLAHEQGNRLLAVDGMQAIARALARALPPGTIALGAKVSRTWQNDDDTWTIRLVDRPDKESRREIRARHVVMAVPAPGVEGLCELPDWKRAALASVMTPGSTTLSVVADISGIPVPGTTVTEVTSHPDEWSFVATPGRVFDAVINPRPGRGDGRLQLVCYGNAAGYLPAADGPAQDAALTRHWVEELLLVARVLRGRILASHLQTWRHCFSLLTPARNDKLDDLRRSVAGTLHFAGDYCSETAGTHGAFAEAERVAAAIRDDR